MDRASAAKLLEEYVIPALNEQTTYYHTLTLLLPLIQDKSCGELHLLIEEILEQQLVRGERLIRLTSALIGDLKNE